MKQNIHFPKLCRLNKCGKDRVHFTNFLSFTLKISYIWKKQKNMEISIQNKGISIQVLEEHLKRKIVLLLYHSQKLTVEQVLVLLNVSFEQFKKIWTEYTQTLAEVSKTNSMLSASKSLAGSLKAYANPEKIEQETEIAWNETVRKYEIR